MMTGIRNLRHLILAAALIPCVVAGGPLLDKANEVYNSGDIHKAISFYEKAALEGENPALCYFNMANAYFQMDSLPQCIVYYKACLSSAPDFFRGYLNLAIAYFTLDDLGACIATVRRALDLEPGHHKALLILAASYRKAGAYPEAVATFEQMVVLEPENEEPYVALAEMYRELEDTEEAVKWLLKYPRGSDNDAYVNILLADIYESQGELDRALYYLRTSYELDSSNKWVYYRMVVLHQRAGNDLVALEEAKKGLRIMPKFAELALLTANLCFQMEKLDEAERYYTTARNNGSAGAVIGLDNLRVMRKRMAESDTFN